MKVSELEVKATQHEIIERIGQIKKADIFGEYVAAIIYYLDYDHAKPYLKDEVTQEEWQKYSDKDRHLREDVQHYLDWWKQKVEDGRGISVHRGRAQMVNRLFLAGISLWKEIGIDDKEGIDGGWYQEDAYNMVADLVELPHIKGHR